MKFYTDPDFFFNLWRNEVMKDNENRKNDNKKKKKVVFFFILSIGDVSQNLPVEAKLDIVQILAIKFTY
jgi:hypothetical protein